MGRTKFDQLSKHVVVGALEASCEVQTELEVTAETQKIDAYVVPDATKTALRERAGLLGRMADGPCLIEAFYRSPTMAQARACMHKQLALDLRLRREARRESADEAPLPTLWIVAGGDPQSVRAALRMRRLKDFPRGCYEAADGLALRLIVTSELPVTRATLLLRLMGGGATLQRALGELEALSQKSWERDAARLWLDAVRLTVVNIEADSFSEDEMYDYEAMRKAVEQLRSQDVQEGLQAGLQAGHHELMLRHFAQRLRRPLSEAESLAVIVRFESHGVTRLSEALFDLEAAQLALWLADPNAT